MKVLKFGGTSVGKPERMHSVAQLISSADQKLVVLSAVSGTTNALVKISEHLTAGKAEEGKAAIAALFESYRPFVDQLYSTEACRKAGHEVIDGFEQLLSSYVGKPFGDKETRFFLAQGELISTRLFHDYLIEKGYTSVLLPALEYMRTDADSEPDLNYIEKHLQPLIEQNKDAHLFITQGYICLNADDEVDNLKRGGSDYTASLVGAALRAEEIQIWTDIDGMHNNDPRIVKRTFPIEELTFDEASELAYFGAKILHPSTIVPAQKYSIPVRLLNTMQPEAKGTVIATRTIERDVKAIAAKDAITAIKVKSSRMLLAYGFLRKVFEIFESYKTPIDMITTSEIAVSLTIDDTRNLEKILAELASFCIVEVEHDQTIICVVGQNLQEKNGVVRRVFDALDEIPVRMISYGGSKNNISILLKSEYKAQAMEALNEGLFFAEAVAKWVKDIRH